MVEPHNLTQSDVSVSTQSGVLSHSASIPARPIPPLSAAALRRLNRPPLNVHGSRPSTSSTPNTPNNTSLMVKSLQNKVTIDELGKTGIIMMAAEAMKQEMNVDTGSNNSFVQTITGQ